MNKREIGLRIARYSEALDKLNWMARWREMMEDARSGAAAHDDRYALYQDVHDQLGAGPVTYLEFGVASGKSLRAWIGLNRDPASRFVGFDTFTGLPEDWNHQFSKGAFSTAGNPPAIEDPRVSFQIGLFQETLRPFLREFRPAGTLVVHLDADLYSATLYALTQLDAHMPSGTVLLFDEFQSFLHEFRAWHDYSSAYGRPWRVLGLAKHGIHAAFQLTA